MARQGRRKQVGIAFGQCASACRVESLVSVDERGQMVLPKALRERAGIKAGDKLAVVVWQRGGRLCCLALVKAETLTGMVHGFLGPIMKDLSGGS